MLKMNLLNSSNFYEKQFLLFFFLSIKRAVGSKT